MVPAKPRTAPPAAPSADLLAAAASARAVVVGVVHDVAPLDLHGFAANVAVERSLAGSLAAGSTTRVAWEELASTRLPRLADGERVLLALAPLPEGSLWTQRFPKRDALAIGADGGAFLRAPDPASLDLLERYLVVPADSREEESGIVALAALAADAEPILAGGAVRALAAIPGLSSRLPVMAEKTLSRAILDPARPIALRIALAKLAGERRLVALRPALDRATAPGSPIEAEAWEAIAAQSGGLPADTVAALLQRPAPALRRVAFECGGAAVPRERALALVKNDPAPEVRFAAGEWLLQREGVAGLGDVTPLLFDPEPSVRAKSADRIGRLGSEAVPTLRALVTGRSGDEAKGPIAALSLAGPEGRAALREIAATTSDESVRNLAKLALGNLDTH